MPSSDTQFRKGQSGNPGGRPKSRAIADELRKQLSEAAGDSTKLECVVSALIASAMDGNIYAIREIADRLDGKPTQAIDIDASGVHFAIADRPMTVDEFDAEFGVEPARGAEHVEH